LGNRGLASEHVARPRSETHASSERAPALVTTHRAGAQKERTVVKRPFLIRPNDLCVATDQEKERQYRQKQSDELIDLMLARLDLLASQESDGNPELHATRLSMYQKGMFDALIRTAPDLADELATRIETELCDESPEASHVISLSRIVHDMPELANERAFDCIASRGKEDTVLWSVLDAWRATGLPETPALAAVRRTASDERTKMRFQGEDAVPARADDEQQL
jgi:hypothetical protein